MAVIAVKTIKRGTLPWPRETKEWTEKPSSQLTKDQESVTPTTTLFPRLLAEWDPDYPQHELP